MNQLEELNPCLPVNALLLAATHAWLLSIREHPLAVRAGCGMLDADCFCADESSCLHHPGKEEATGETDKMRKAAKLEMQTEERHWERANRRGRFQRKRKM